MLTFIFGIVCFALGVGFMPAINWIKDQVWDKAYRKGRDEGWKDGWDNAYDTCKKI